MLEGRKYQGPGNRILCLGNVGLYFYTEVDVWSLGIILYCLLTGTLPFDDDDEDMMRAKIIKGDFEDPDWLSIGVPAHDGQLLTTLTLLIQNRVT